LAALTASGLAVAVLDRCRLVALPCLPLLGGQVEVLVRTLTVSLCSSVAAVWRWIAFELLPGVGAAGELPPADAAAVVVLVAGEVLAEGVGVGVVLPEGVGVGVGVELALWLDEGELDGLGEPEAAGVSVLQFGWLRIPPGVPAARGNPEPPSRELELAAEPPVPCE